LIVLRNSAADWGSVARTLHWLLAILIVLQLGLGTLAENADLSPRKLDLFVWHKSIGLTVLLLVLLRIGWRLTNPTPVPSAQTAPVVAAAGKLGHASLYVLMLVVPLSGWWVSDTSRIPFRAFWHVPVPDLLSADRAASQLAERIHGGSTKLLLLLIVVHILAALWHHYRLRDDTLSRMLPLTRPNDHRPEEN